MEDVDTSPGDPTRVVLGNQFVGVYTFDFDLDFSSGIFSAADSGFSIDKIHTNVGNPDNVDWTAPTVLNGTAYPEGLVFVNVDNSNGTIWVGEPDGTDATRIGDTRGPNGASSESSGILDISDLVGYNPGSIVLTNNQGSRASMTVLINPDATLAVPRADQPGFDAERRFARRAPPPPLAAIVNG